MKHTKILLEHSESSIKKAKENFFNFLLEKVKNNKIAVPKWWDWIGPLEVNTAWTQMQFGYGGRDHPKYQDMPPLTIRFYQTGEIRILVFDDSNTFIINDGPTKLNKFLQELFDISDLDDLRCVPIHHIVICSSNKLIVKVMSDLGPLKAIWIDPTNYERKVEFAKYIKK
jgi:hypothetical protein